jgi:cytochrome c-type biogenesis protein CcmF
MPVLGSLCLHLAVLTTALAAPLFFRATSERGLVLARAFLWAGASFFTAALSALAVAAVAHDFRIEYIAGYTDRTTALPYLLTAVWAGQAGSLLFWACLLGWLALPFAGRLRRRAPTLEGGALGWLCLVMVFFGAVLVGWSNPFLSVDGSGPVDGSGLNPLLRNVMMIFHPPALLAGYAAYAPSAALAAACLMRGELSPRALAELRHWALIAWVFLSLGNLLGMVWAYEELGWGGYWGWDPVENASLIPWLTGTALLHVLMVERKAKSLAGWTLILTLLTFWLTLLGTYLTRSGIVASVHAFNRTVVADAFAVLLVVVALLAVGGLAFRRRLLTWPAMLGLSVVGPLAIMASLVVLAGALPWGPWLAGAASVVAVLWRGWRSDQAGRLRRWFTGYGAVFAVAGLVQPLWWAIGALGACVVALVGFSWGAWRPAQVAQLAPRTPLLVVTTLLLVAVAGGVLFGTLLPVTSRLVTGDAVQVDGQWYEGWFIPSGLLLLVVTAFCLLWDWRGLAGTVLARRLGLGTLAALGAGAWAWQGGIRHGSALAAIVLSAALVVAGVYRAWSAWRAFSRSPVGHGAGRYRLLFQRLGAVVAHLGLAVMCIGFSGEANKQEQTLLLTSGEPVAFGQYALEVHRVAMRSEWQREVLEATIRVTDADGRIHHLAPARHQYRSHANQPTSEAAVLSTVTGDLFLTLGEVERERGRVWVRAIVTPRLQWIWAGGTLITLGGLVAVLLAFQPRRRWWFFGGGVTAVALAAGGLIRPWFGPATILVASVVVALWVLGRAWLTIPRSPAPGSGPAPRRCRSCGSTLMAGSGFCHRCGAKVAVDG